MNCPQRHLTFWALGIFAILGATACLARPGTVLNDLLQRPYELTIQRPKAKASYYRMTTVYAHMNSSGGVAERQVLEGYFQRSPGKGEPEEEGDGFAWKFVQIGIAQDKEEIREWRVLPFTRDFEYNFSQWMPDRFPVDQASIPKTMEGWQFFVKLLDAHTFDVIADIGHYDRKLEHVGDTARLSGESIKVNMDFPPLFTDTHFTTGSLTTAFLGITLFRQMPCAILSFFSDDCHVRLVANMNNLKLPTEGTSSYHGEILLSLESGQIVRGKILERVDMITQLPNAVTPNRHSTRREITLEEIGRPAFNHAREPGTRR